MIEPNKPWNAKKQSWHTIGHVLHMKSPITSRELSILAGVVVALIVMLMLWINQLGGSFSIVSLSEHDINDHLDPRGLKTLFQFKWL
jgi:hypothetical protein